MRQETCSTLNVISIHQQNAAKLINLQITASGMAHTLLMVVSGKSTAIHRGGENPVPKLTSPSIFTMGPKASNLTSATSKATTVASKISSVANTAATDAQQALSKITGLVASEITTWCSKMPTYCCLRDDGNWQLGQVDGNTTTAQLQGSSFGDLLNIGKLKDITKGLPSVVTAELDRTIFKVLEFKIDQFYGILMWPKWLFLAACIIPVAVTALEFIWPRFSSWFIGLNLIIMTSIFALCSSLLLTVLIFAKNKISMLNLEVAVLPGTILFASFIGLLYMFTESLILLWTWLARVKKQN